MRLSRRFAIAAGSTNNETPTVLGWGFFLPDRADSRVFAGIPAEACGLRRSARGPAQGHLPLSPGRFSLRPRSPGHARSPQRPRGRHLQINGLRAAESNGWIAASPDQRKPPRSCRRRGGLKDVRNSYILLTNGDHSMSQLSEAILSAAQALPEGGLISPKEFLHLASRAAVDQALARLAREGKLLRVGRGAYALPVASRFGSRPPSTEAVVEAIASTHGEVVVPNGAAEANALGLTT